MSLEDDTTAVSPAPGERNADAAAVEKKNDGESTPKLSKNQLKKLAKGKGEKKKDKDKPAWNQPGEGKKAKAKKKE